MNIFIAILFAIHGCLHFLGVVRTDKNLRGDKVMGVLWLTAGIAMLGVPALLLLRMRTWWIAGAAAIAISQLCIISAWQKARAGTLINILLLAAVITGLAGWDYHKRYESDARDHLNTQRSNTIVTENDLAPLPEMVQHYLRYSGCVGKPQVMNFKAEMKGRLRADMHSNWMPFRAEQYNFIGQPTRLFFLDATMRSLPVPGYHKYSEQETFMDIRLLSLARVQYMTGEEMRVAETVTFFNDMCVMAPATLIDKRIKWLDTNSHEVTALFTNNNISVKAHLVFNDSGQLVNFISDDRKAYQANGTLRKAQWSTPLSRYGDINGLRLATAADAVYHYPDGDLTYGQFEILRVEYNIYK